MKNKTLNWIFTVLGRKKLYILFLIAAQALYGSSGVLYALCLRKIVDAATGQDSSGFWYGMIMTIVLLLAELGLGTIIRWLTELSKSTGENLFKARLMRSLLKKDYLRISAIHSWC